jgi:hypothetical protein
VLQSQFYDLAAPVPGQVFSLAHSLTAATYAIPPQWRGKIVDFTSTGADLYVLIGDANTLIESAEVAVSVGGTLASNWASGDIVPAGATKPIPIPEDPLITHFAVDSSVAAGQWSARVSSGNPAYWGEQLPAAVGSPLLWIDAGYRSLLAVDSGAVTVSSAKSRPNGYQFSEASAKPDLLTAAGSGAGLIRPALSFVAGSSEKLLCADAALAAALAGNVSFTLFVSLRRATTGANHTIFSVNTSGSANGHFDLAVDSSDDLVMTRVDSSGNSATATYTASLNTAYSIVITYDGTTNVLYVDGTADTFTASGTFATIGTPTHVSIGSRFINATHDRYATMELCDLMLFNEAFTAPKLTALQDWVRRRTGK